MTTSVQTFITKVKVSAIAGLMFLSVFSFLPDLTLAAADNISSSCTTWQNDQGLCTVGLRLMIGKLVNWALLFLGLVATSFLIFGGFMYITSAGNDQNVEKAKKLIIYAAVGIVIILLSAVLVDALIRAPSDSGQAAGTQ